MDSGVEARVALINTFIIIEEPEYLYLVLIYQYVAPFKASMILAEEKL